MASNGRRSALSPSRWTVFTSRAATAAAISELAIPLLVGQRAAISGERHLLFDVANVVENGFDRCPGVNRVRASRAGAGTIGAVSFIRFSMVNNRRIHRHVLPTPAFEMAAPHAHCECPQVVWLRFDQTSLVQPPHQAGRPVRSHDGSAASSAAMSGAVDGSEGRIQSISHAPAPNVSKQPLGGSSKGIFSRRLPLRAPRASSTATSPTLTTHAASGRGAMGATTPRFATALLDCLHDCGGSRRRLTDRHRRSAVLCWRRPKSQQSRARCPAACEP